MTAEPHDTEAPTKLPFPPVTKEHILNCSYHSWHPKYRAITPKARLIPLPPSFLSYLRSDGIILPPELNANAEWSDNDSGIFSGADTQDEDADEEETSDPSAQWRETHEAIAQAIEELGGKVAPKLNWSAPKDATWMAATNSMECRTPNDIYLLLKSSDFVTHDLAHAFDDTVDSPTPEIPYHLILRKYINLNPSLEFRCFARCRQLIAICQRDLNHFDFLFNMQDQLRQRIQEFFDVRLRDTFPDENFTFDVYIPPPHERVWLVDVNPWAMRTDPLLFSWLELLTMDMPKEPSLQTNDEDDEQDVARIYVKPRSGEGSQSNQSTNLMKTDTGKDGESEEDEDDSDVEELWMPEFRLVRRDDPEAYGFTTPQYSAHKLPKDVVDASRGGEANLREFAMQWKEAQRLAEEQAREDSEDDD